MLRNEASKRLQRTVFIEVGDSNAGTRGTRCEAKPTGEANSEGRQELS